MYNHPCQLSGIFDKKGGEPTVNTVDYIFHCLSQLALQLRLFSFTLKSHEARIRRLEKKVKELSGE
jgi:hypothetical protein